MSIMVKAKNLVFEYIRRDKDDNVVDITTAIDHLNISVEQGDFIAVLGHNGSGKSTFAKHINSLLIPTKGSVWIDGKDTTDMKKILEIRQSAGMVFQNPDNQIVANIVEEDVAFGPENMGVESQEIRRRVEESLDTVDMLSFRRKSPNCLSGGQKQRVAISGVMAMHPKCIVLDEPTAMLDPLGRKEVLDAIYKLNKREHVTIILITHYMEEVVNADYVYVMDHGEIVMDGKPRDVFSRVEELRKYRLDVPQVTELAYEMKKEGFLFSDGIMTVEEFENEIEKYLE